MAAHCAARAAALRAAALVALDALGGRKNTGSVGFFIWRVRRESEESEESKAGPKPWPLWIRTVIGSILVNAERHGN